MVMRELDLRLVSTEDALTGVLSRHAFREHAQGALALALRHRYPLSCIVFDLDHLKAVNDTHGHAVGDRILARSAQACREGLRKSDILGRVGGEEFAIVLPHTSRDEAAKVAEKTRQRIASVRVESAGSPVAVSASFGIAELAPDAADLDDLLRRAETAMAEAKQAGRNRCALADQRRCASPGTGSMRRVFKAGRITLGTGQSSVACTVRALSDERASLDVVNAAAIPPAFRLRIHADGTERRCKLLTRRSHQLDVVFE